MNTIKFYKTKSFEFKETVWKRYFYPDGTSQLASWQITHNVPGNMALIDNKHVYFGYKLHDLPPFPSMTPDNTYDGAGKDAECDDKKFYLRKGTIRIRPLKDDTGEVIGDEEYYQKHVKDFFNKDGLTYILFHSTFAGGGFKLQADRILNGQKTLDRNNLYYRTPPAELMKINWL